MRITNLTEYGVICALHLAHRTGDGPISGREIATREQLPADFVEQILLRLRRAGIVRSTRGAHGGYELALPPSAISIRQIVDASEESTFHLNCDSHPVGTDRCSASHSCSIRPVWMLLRNRIEEVLDGVLLSDLVNAEPEVQQRIGLPTSSLTRDVDPARSSRSLPVVH